MRALVPGERVRLTPGGQVCEVIRVSACAAYIQAVFEPPVYRVFNDPRTGEEKRIKVSRGPIQPGISPCAFVYRDEAAGDEARTCGCGIYVHPSRRNPRAIHIDDCPWHEGAA